MSLARSLVCKVLCLGLGVFLANSLTDVLRPRIALILPVAPAPTAVAVSIRVPPVPPKEGLLARSVLPLKVQQAVAGEKIQSGQLAPGDETSPDGRVRDTALPEEMEENFEQQASPQEPTGKLYAETPGGDVLVLGLLVNDQNLVLDSRVLVPSFNQMADMAISMAAVGQRFTQGIYPPLKYGESRWVEYRISLDDPLKEKHVLP